MCHCASRMNSSLRLEKSEKFSCEAQIIIIVKKSTDTSLFKDAYFKVEHTIVKGFRPIILLILINPLVMVLVITCEKMKATFI